MAEIKEFTEKRQAVTFVDLFAGIGGIRLGFEQAAKSRGLETRCVLTSEIKSHAISVLQQNYSGEEVSGDITQICTSDIPDFDILLAGFPCQAFSAAGKRLGFLDTRGTMFFEVERILKDKQPKGFILENVEGLVNHDKANRNAPIGRTLETILNSLDSLGYKVSWRVLNSCNFGLPQERKRIYIVGTRTAAPDLDNWQISKATLRSVLEQGLPTSKTSFIDKLLSHFSPQQLYGKSLKDKRGGENNIHSWDIELKGAVSIEQRKLLNELFKQRRKKQWAQEFGVDWMDGMPLTLKQISTFFPHEQLEDMLEDLCVKGYLVKEHPKALVEERDIFDNVRKVRRQDHSLPLGYNIVTGKLSFEVGKILDPNDVAPTLVAMDMQRLYVVDGDGLRRLTLREGLRLFGYPEDYKFNICEADGFDLLGNTVCVPVIRNVAERLLDIIIPVNTMRYTAQQVYDRLINDDKILTIKGQIRFFLGDVDIIVRQKDVVGNIIQEWLQGWLDKRGIEYAPCENTQMPPDFFLNPEDKKVNLLEVKAFDRKKGPGFDIADFRMYQDEIVKKPWMLNVDYLIFGYNMSDDGVVTIKDLWLKKVWEITRPMDKWPINLQIKEKVVHKIRPGVWYSKAKNPKLRIFGNMEDFVSAIEQTVWQNPDTRKYSGTWREEFLESYQVHYGISLNIPRWQDIEAVYRTKKEKKKK